jgi:hypothetical protein
VREQEPTPPAGRQFRWFHIKRSQYLGYVFAVATDGTAWEATMTLDSGEMTPWRPIHSLPEGEW